MTSPSLILTPWTRATIFDPPSERAEALRRYALAPEDIARARRHRRAHNRLGFAVQMALVRDLGRPLRPSEILPGALVEVVAEQLGVEPAVFDLYARRDETRREHAGEITILLGLQTMRQADYRASIMAAAQAAAGTERGEPIVCAILEDLKLRRVIVPLPSMVERLALAGRAWARRQSYRDLIRGLDNTARHALEALLSTRAEDDRSQHGWIGEVPEGPRLKNLAGVIARLQVLRRIGLADERRKTVHANRYGVIAREARITHARGLRHLTQERRLATLVAFTIERQTALTDLAVEMFDKLIGTARRRAKTRHDERLLAQAKNLAGVARTHVVLGRALMDARQTGTDLLEAVESALGWTRLGASVEAAAEALGKDEGDGLDEMVGRFSSLRRAASLMFEAFTFRSHRTGDPILAAIALLGDLHHGRRRKLPERPPTVFLRRAWRKRVKAGPDRFDARAYEVAVIVHLRDRLRAGDVWGEGSRAWRQFEDYLLPHATFAVMRDECRLGLALPDSGAAWIETRGAVLRAKLETLAAEAAAGRLADATITDAGLSISPIRRQDQDDARALSARLYNLMPRIRITDLLAEVDGWTGFAKCFTHFRTGEIAGEPPALMGAILADATNLGLERMAESSRGVTIHQLNLMIFGGQVADGIRIKIVGLAHRLGQAQVTPLAGCLGDPSPAGLAGPAPVAAAGAAVRLRRI